MPEVEECSWDGANHSAQDTAVDVPWTLQVDEMYCYPDSLMQLSMMSGLHSFIMTIQCCSGIAVILGNEWNCLDKPVAHVEHAMVAQENVNRLGLGHLTPALQLGRGSPLIDLPCSRELKT